MSRIVPVAVGDTVRLRKPHPCGGRGWQVTRIGADIGLKCLTCGHVVLLDRETFERRIVVPMDKPDAASLDPAAEQALADEGLAVEVKQRPAY